MEFAKRMNQFGEGVFSRLAEMRKKRTAAGKEVFDLSIGAPNIPPAKHIMEDIAQAVMEPKNYVYAITDTAELLQAVEITTIIKLTIVRQGVFYDKAAPLITAD